MLDREYWALMANPAGRKEVSADEMERPLANMVQIRVDRTRKLAWFQHDDLILRPGERVVVETERGTGSGEVLTWPSKRSGVVKGARRVLRKFEPGQGGNNTVRDRGVAREQQALRVCADLISTFQLDMKLVSVEHVQWENRAVFYFVAEGRVDFRDLVKELSRVLRCRIEMRQIGPRDETKMLGGLGRCGREFCCGTFLNEFRSVRTKMAKEQGLVVNQEKITGHCRKLLCCLAYERESYAALRASLPPLGAIVETEEGPAKVLELYVLKQAVKIQNLEKFDNIKVVAASGLRVQGGGKVGVGVSGLDDGDDDDDSLRDLEDDGVERPEGEGDKERRPSGDRGREGRRVDGRDGSGAARGPAPAGGARREGDRGGDRRGGSGPGPRQPRSDQSGGPGGGERRDRGNERPRSEGGRTEGGRSEGNRDRGGRGPERRMVEREGPQESPNSEPEAPPAQERVVPVEKGPEEA